MTKILLIASTVILLTAALVFSIKEQRMNAEIRSAAEVNAGLLKEMDLLRLKVEEGKLIAVERDRLKADAQRHEAYDELKRTGAAELNPEMSASGESVSDLTEAAETFVSYQN